MKITLANLSAQKKYYTLLSRDNPQWVWQIQFGDYDRATVQNEMEDYRTEYKARDLKIICTFDGQQHIDSEVSRLNEYWKG